MAFPSLPLSRRLIADLHITRSAVRAQRSGSFSRFRQPQWPSLSASPDPNPASGRDQDGAGGGAAFAGEVPGGGSDHDGRRGAPAGVHDLPQQALAVLRRLRLRWALFLLQADVGTRVSSD